MPDQCQHCTVRGDYEKCIETPCFHHENWINLQRIDRIRELETKVKRLEWAGEDLKLTISMIIKKDKSESTKGLQSAFVAGAEFGVFHGSEFERLINMKLFPHVLQTFETEAAKRYPKGGCDEDE